MHFSIDVFGNQIAFTDVALSCFFALKSLGWKCCIKKSRLSREGVNIIFGANSLNKNIELPKNSIIYDFEQLSSGYYTDVYINHMKNINNVWVFSEVNAKALKDRHAIDTTYVFPGYVPEMSCLAPHENQSSTILFYGRAVPRRQKALDAVRQKGLPLQLIEATGIERDRHIATAAILLNVHALVPANLEIARLGFLWANKKAVLSEDCPEFGIPASLEEACFYAPYENLQEAALELCKRPALRNNIAVRGFKAYAAHPLAKILENIVGRPVKQVSETLLPDSLNFGTDRIFLPFSINIDARACCHPDIILDPGMPFPWEKEFHTQRFGNIAFKKGQFAKIFVNHVLERSHDVVQTMQNFMELLRPDGELEINVFHQFSRKMAKDPGNIHPFNEESWSYYCDQFYELGWRDYCFAVEDIKLIESEYGKTLFKKGLTSDEVLQTPGSIETMRVRLRKRETSPAERQRCEQYFQPVYDQQYGGWMLAPQ